MDLDLQFRLLKAPPSTKALLALRKDAGLSGSLPGAKPGDLRGKVQWVAVELKNKQIGIARLELAPPEFCFVSDLMIASQHRGRGAGEWLLKHIEQYCLSLNIRRLLLEAEDGTDKFYIGQSFVADPLLPRLYRKEINPFQRKLFAPALH